MELDYSKYDFSRLAKDFKPEDIPKDQLWWWTKEWQAGEREVDEDIKYDCSHHTF